MLATLGWARLLTKIPSQKNQLEKSIKKMTKSFFTAEQQHLAINDPYSFVVTTRKEMLASLKVPIFFYLIAGTYLHKYLPVRTCID